MGFNSAFKALKLLNKTRERAFKQFKWPRPQCIKLTQQCLTSEDMYARTYVRTYVHLENSVLSVTHYCSFTHSWESNISLLTHVFSSYHSCVPPS